MSQQFPSRVRLTPEDRELLQRLREAQPSKTHLQHTPLTLGERAADFVAASVGSWRFIIIQSLILTIWIVLNLTAWIQHWDPYPFILLNLVLSFQAAYTGPIVMMSQNRSSDIDRKRAKQDLECDTKAHLEILLVHEKLNRMRESEFSELRNKLERIEALLLEQNSKPHQQN